MSQLTLLYWSVYSVYWPDYIGGQLREHRVSPVEAGDDGGRGVGDGLVLGLTLGHEVADDVEHEHDGHEELEDETVVGEASLVIDDPWQGRATEVPQGEGGCEQPGHLWLVDTLYLEASHWIMEIFRGFSLDDGNI